MPLVDHRPPPSPLNISPLRLAVALPVTVFAFVVVLAIAARHTADGALLPPRVGVDAGIPPGRDSLADARSPTDAGSGATAAENDDVSVDGDSPPAPLVTVSPDAGPVFPPGPAVVPGPPFAPTAVIEAAVVVVEACAADALRWDPSLGGPFSLQVDLGPLFAAVDGNAPPVLSTPGLSSPVLASCLQRRAVDVQLPPLGDVEVPLAVHARATLGAHGTIAWSDVVITMSGASGVKTPATSE